MERRLFEKLAEWETESVKEPLMLIGVRQVGKTWLIKHFCKERYEDTFYVNLEEQPSFQSAFDGDLSPAVLLRNLGILAGRTITEKTTIVLDETEILLRSRGELQGHCGREPARRENQPVLLLVPGRESTNPAHVPYGL